ncbi:MAG: Ig-like domain-containing protein, partial [Candidatus Njordarchaeota archaeon]
MHRKITLLVIISILLCEIPTIASVNTIQYKARVDTQPPIIEISPENGSYVTGVVTLTIEVTDNIGVDTVKLYIDGTLKKVWNYGGTLTYDWDTTQYDDGTSHYVKVWANDTSGNIEEKTYEYIVDHTPPTVDISHPANGSYLNTHSVDVTWTGSDNYLIHHYEVKLDDGEWIDVGLNTSYEFYVEDGVHIVYVKVVDMAGNEGYDNVTFYVDTQPPAVCIIHPQEGDVIGSHDVLVEWSGSDNIGIHHYEVKLDDGEWIDVGLGTSWLFTDVLDGSHRAYARVYDMAGNIGIDSVLFYVDTSPPQVTILSPSNGSYVKSLSLRYSGSDVSGIAYYEVKLDDGEWRNVGKDTTVTFLSNEEGLHWMYVRATDWAGNTGEPAGVYVYLDLTAPNLTILSPQQGEFLDMDYVIAEWSGSDNYGIDHYEIRLDDGEWIDIGLGTSYTFSDLSEGLHTLYVRAYDIAGRITEKQVDFYVDITAPQFLDVIYSNDSQNYMLYNDTTIISAKPIVFKTQAKDSVGLAEIKVEINGSIVWSKTFTELQTHVYIEFSLETYTISTFVMVLYAWDWAGHECKIVYIFKIIGDIEPPTILSIIFPNGTYTNNDTIYVNFTAEDNTMLDHYEILLDGRIVYSQSL